MNTLAIANSGLKTAQAAIGNEGHNIANASTKGFTRKNVEPQTQTLNGQGNGVAASVPHRVVDQSLIHDEREKISSSNFQGSKAMALNSVQMVMGTPGGKNSLSEMIKDFSNKCEAVSLEATSTLKRKEVLRTLDAVNQELARLTEKIQSERRTSDAAIKTAVDEVNASVAEVDVLNKQIIANTRAGLAKDDLEDQRDNAIRTIAKHLDINVREDGNGGVFLQTSAGVSLLTPEITKLEFTPTTFIDASSQYNNDPNLSNVNHVTYSDSAGNVYNITESFKSGDIAAHIEIRDRALTDLQAQLDRLATNFRDKLNEAHNQGAGFPPANTLTGTRTFATPATDIFQGNGTIRIAVIDKATGQFVAGLHDLDLTNLGAVTINALAGNIDAGLNGATITVNANGQLTMSADNANHAVALIPVGGPATENGTGLGFSHYFGLNDLVTSPGHSYDPDPNNLIPGIANQLGIRQDLQTDDTLLSRGKISDVLPTPNIGDQAILNGDSRTAQSLVTFLKNPQTFVNTGGLGDRQVTFQDYSSAIISEAARQAHNTDNIASREKDALANITYAQGQVSGVDQQESLLNILPFQQMFMGCSTVIKVEKENMSFLMNIVS